MGSPSKAPSSLAFVFHEECAVLGDIDYHDYYFFDLGDYYFDYDEIMVIDLSRRSKGVACLNWLVELVNPLLPSFTEIVKWWE